MADLTESYTDEWPAHYQYCLLAGWIRGVDADTLKDILVEQSNDELGHAEKIANRMIELCGAPIINAGKSLETSDCEYEEPLSDSSNLKQAIQHVPEACAIETYEIPRFLI